MKKNKIADYFIQLIIVVVGVFIGMLASEWSLRRNTQHNKQEILIGLKEELKGNLQYLEQRSAKYPAFQRALDSLSEALTGKKEVLDEKFDQERFIDRIKDWPGLGKPKMNNAIYETAKSSDVLPSLDIKLLQKITKTYNLQSNLDEIRKTFGDQFFDIDADTKYYEVIDLMWYIMEEYFGIQYILMKEYKETIELIESKNSP